MGGNWRMPTFDECKELCLNTDIYLVPTDGEEIQGTAQETGVGGIMIKWESQATFSFKGVKFYKKGDKQTYIFVPASGAAYEGSMQSLGLHGNLWSSSLYSSDVKGAWSFGINAIISTGNNVERYRGYPVRGVLAQ